ncbi:hypothetical protein A4X13_0g3109 [Tilletia indica]|uniref:TatD DNase n=1 Tax=Tilletia indica TaxID=43049 RepID=A0A177TRZ5_9BASI|nr:hypothetical protein A4X13_0g3109 [Tilletia indica]
MSSSSPIPPLVEIGFNLVDGMYTGRYQGKKYHEPDLEAVLERARAAGVHRIIATVGSLNDKEAKKTLDLIAPHPDIFCTIGCHPTRSTELDKHPGGVEGFTKNLVELVKQGGNKVVALGECGLDKDRLFFAPLDAQQRAFDIQLRLAAQLKLPLFLHSRNCHPEFVEAVTPHLPSLREALRADDVPSTWDKETAERDGPKLARLGVVHSFTGDLATAKECIEMGFFLSINGCSLKEADQLEVVKQLPLERLLVETDAPWCDIRPTHASNTALQAWKTANPDLSALAYPPTTKREKWKAGTAVKSRNEPCSLAGVTAVVAALKGVSLEEVARHTTANAKWLFRGL